MTEPDERRARILDTLGVTEEELQAFEEGTGYAAAKAQHDAEQEVFLKALGRYSQGIHPTRTQHYVRRIRVRPDDPVVLLMQALDIPLDKGPLILEIEPRDEGA